jgi:hypothetical protein
MTTIGQAIQATHTYWAGTSVSSGFSFEIKFSIVTEYSSSTYFTREDSRKEKESNCSFIQKTAIFTINGIEMPHLFWQSWMHKNDSIETFLSKKINEFFQCQVTEEKDFNGYYPNDRVGKYDKMLSSIIEFDNIFEYKPVMRLDTTFSKEKESGSIMIVSRKDF